VVGSIRDTMPKPEDAKAVPPAVKAEKSAGAPVAGAAKSASEPLATSMAKVGGGGYDRRHGLDAQRENNQLTRETNQLIGQGNAKLDTLAGGQTPVSPPQPGTTVEVTAPDNTGKQVTQKQVIAIRNIPPNSPDAGESAPEPGKPAIPQPVSVEVFTEPGKPAMPQPVSVQAAPDPDGTGQQAPGGNEGTKGVRHAFGRVVQSIRGIVPKAGEATVPGAGVLPPEPTGIPAIKPGLAVEALGKVGGGYANGTLDAQRENNRLTQETNRILREVSRHLAGDKGGKLTMAFG
jgi:hypothetical protein